MKCDIKIQKILYPKGAINSGDYAIFSGSIIKNFEEEEPVVHPYFNTVTLKGNVPHIREGDTFTINFDTPEVSSYGTSYKINSVSKEIDPSNRKQLKEYFKIIAGNQIAQELMKIKDSYYLLLEKNDSELLKIKGIGKAKLELIYKNVGMYTDLSYAYVELEPLGLTRNLISRIALEVGGSIAAVDICRTNPYSLIKKVKGVSFTIADQIAIKCGLDCYSPVRLSSAIEFILETSGECGKSYLTATQLINEINKIIALEMSQLSNVVNGLIENGIVVVSEDGNNIALAEYLKLENDIAIEINRLKNAQSEIKIPKNWMEIVKIIEEEQGWDYTDEQLEGIELGLMNNLLLVSGKAGSGKSTITNGIVKILENYHIDMCCLSAKAAQRLKEVSGLDAKTIHRLLGLGIESSDDVSEILSDVIILDEASMVSGTLFLKLLQSIPDGSKLIILGDDGQLTAIGNCSVFSDLKNSNKISKIELTKIHRQAKKSAIITKSIDIRNQIAIYESGFVGHRILGELQDLELFVESNNSKLLEIVKKKFIEDLNVVKNILEVQVICPLKKRGELSTQAINHELQKIYIDTTSDNYTFINKETKIFIGDKVINTKNNYNSNSPQKKKRPVFNGSIGIVKTINKSFIVVDFVGIGEVVIGCKEYGDLNLAYAITVHSSQGSQWSRVICVFDMSSYILLNVEILYTGITRAMDHCSLVIENTAMKRALSNVEQKTKQTLLNQFLQNI